MAVVISQNVVLSALTGSGAGRPLIGWRNFITSWSVVADYEDQFFPAVNLANPSTASQWRSTSLDVQYITVNISPSDEIDYVGLARHNLGSSQAQISIEAKTAAAPAVWTEIFTTSTLSGDEPAILRFDPVAAQEVRIKITPSLAIPRLSVLYVGKLTTMQRGMAQEVAALPYAYDTDVVTGMAESGDFLGRIVTGQSKSMDYTFEHVNYDWFHAELGPFAKAALVTPFFYAWLPKSYPNEVGYGWLNSDIRPVAFRYEFEHVVTFTLNIGAIAV